MPRLSAALIAIVMLLGSAALAQTYPSRGETPVNDDAEIIDAETEARIATRLTELRAAGGAEIVVVTLLSTALYTGGDEIADYAENLFSQWELEDAAGRAVLLVVFHEDRELRIELGSAYGAEDEATAQGVITDLIVPQFREDAFGAGIEAGIGGLIDRIIVPAQAPAAQEAPVVTETAPAATDAVPAATPDAAPSEGGGGAIWWIAGLVAAPVALIVGLSRRRAAKLAATPCPTCGKTGLREERVTLDDATEWAAGRGETRTICPHCGHTTAVPYSIAKLSQPEKAKSGTAQPARSSAAMGSPTGSNPKIGGAESNPKPAPAPGTKPGTKPGGGGASGNW